MKPDDIQLLSNPDIPESVRAKIAEQVLGAADREAQRALEAERLASEKRKVAWNTPLVAALAGLLTLSATFVFDRLTSKEETANTITLEQVRNELQLSEARLRQELEIAASENLAKLEADAREREFQYEIVRSELANSEKSNAERAAVLLFLVRAGVLSKLNERELRGMAERQIREPEESIVPRLTSVEQSLPGVIDLDDSRLVSDFAAGHPVHQAARSVGRLIIQARGGSTSVCTAFLVAQDKIATARHCLHAGPERMRFELFPVGAGSAFAPAEIDVYGVLLRPIEVHGDGESRGYVVLGLESAVQASYAPFRTDPGTGELDAKLAVVFFRAGNEQRAVWGAPDCRALKWEEELVHHRCDTGPGASGSPIIDIETNAVIGVHTQRTEFGAAAYRIMN